MKTRRGKIARLPPAIRDELNHRLHNGIPAGELARWLNSLPEVQRVLAERFASRSITQDNLSEWRCGGFQDWVFQQERRDHLRELSDHRHQDDRDENARGLHAHMRHALALELTEEFERVSQMDHGKERWNRLRRIIQQMCSLQNAHNRDRELLLREFKSGIEAKYKSV